MKVLALVKNGNAETAFQEQEREQPKIDHTEVLIKVEAFGLNFADVMARLGLYREAPPLPAVLGYEVVGEIISAGQDVENTWVGKRVVAFTRFGGYAQFVKTNVLAVVEIGDMDAGKATALATQYGTAWYMAAERAFIRKGDRVLVHAAAGGVGTALTQILKQKGCYVYGTTSSNNKFEYLKNNGVDYPINYTTHNYAEEISKHSPKKITTSFNAVGGGTFKKDMKLITPGGTVFTFGAASRTGKKGGFFANISLLFSMGFTHPLFLMMQSKTIAGVNMLAVGDHQPEVLQDCIKKVVQWTEEGKLNPIVGDIFMAKDIAKAHAKLESRTSVGKIAVKW